MSEPWSETWYRAAAADEPLTQGDLVFGCPALSWKLSAIKADDGSIAKKLSVGEHLLAVEMDPVVMTQASDLEHGKVGSVVRCHHYGLEEFKTVWEADQEGRGQNPTAKAWHRYLDNVREGTIWNLSLLNTEEVEGFQ